jgi:uncharacterized protein YxjI
MQQYPLQLTFKFWTFAPKISIVDRHGKPVFFVRQQLFRLKEVIDIFADDTLSEKLFTIKADRIIDFSAKYSFTNSRGQVLGAVKRRGIRSLWKAHYEIFEANQVTFNIHEDNPWIKVMDSLFAEIPIVGMFTGMVFNPAYLVTRPNGEIVMRLEKIPSFWSRLYSIKQLNTLNNEEETLILLSQLMMILLERNRG